MKISKRETRQQQDAPGNSSKPLGQLSRTIKPHLSWCIPHYPKLSSGPSGGTKWSFGPQLLLHVSQDAPVLSHTASTGDGERASRVPAKIK